MKQFKPLLPVTNYLMLVEILSLIDKVIMKDSKIKDKWKKELKYKHFVLRKRILSHAIFLINRMKHFLANCVARISFSVPLSKCPNKFVWKKLGNYQIKEVARFHWLPFKERPHASLSNIGVISINHLFSEMEQFW